MSLELRHHKVVSNSKVLIPYFVTGLEQSSYRGTQPHLVPIPEILRIDGASDQYHYIPAYKSITQPGPRNLRLEVAARKFNVGVKPDDPGFYMPSNEHVEDISGMATLGANGVDEEDAENALLDRIIDEMGKERPSGSEKSGRVQLYNMSRAIPEAATYYINPQAIEVFRQDTDPGSKQAA
jgi:hypothetical protein